MPAVNQALRYVPLMLTLTLRERKYHLRGGSERLKNLPKGTQIHLTPKSIFLVQFQLIVKQIKIQRDEVTSRVTDQVVPEVRPESLTLVQCFFYNF